MATDSGPAWTIVSQVPTIDRDAAGNYVQGVRVTYRTAAGTTGSVFVPEDQYTPDRVRSMVAERAATSAAIEGMTG